MQNRQQYLQLFFCCGWAVSGSEAGGTSRNLSAVDKFESAMNPRLILITGTFLLLGFFIWREAYLLRTTIAKRRYLGAISEVLIFAGVNFLMIVFLSYELGTLAPRFGILSEPFYVRMSFSSLLMGVTVSWVGETAVEARKRFSRKQHVQFTLFGALSLAGLLAALFVQMNFLIN